MFYINYDLARLIGDERRAAASRSHLRRDARTTAAPPSPARDEEADVVELVFGTQCEPDRIGA